MPNYNKLILVGNLTRDPAIRVLPSQVTIADFGIAVNRRWKGADGQQCESVMFLDCTAFGKRAESINQWLRKGVAVLLEGRLEFDQWQDKDGNARSKHKMLVESCVFMSPPDKAQPAKPAPAAPPPVAPPPAAPPPPIANDLDEDLPF